MTVPARNSTGIFGETNAHNLESSDYCDIMLTMMALAKPSVSTYNNISTTSSACYNPPPPPRDQSTISKSFIQPHTLISPRTSRKRDSNCLKFHNFVPNDELMFDSMSENGHYLREEHGSKQINVCNRKRQLSPLRIFENELSVKKISNDRTSFAPSSSLGCSADASNEDRVRSVQQSILQSLLVKNFGVNSNDKEGLMGEPKVDTVDFPQLLDLRESSLTCSSKNILHRRKPTTIRRVLRKQKSSEEPLNLCVRKHMKNGVNLEKVSPILPTMQIHPEVGRISSEPPKNRISGCRNGFQQIQNPIAFDSTPESSPISDEPFKSSFSVEKSFKTLIPNNGQFSNNSDFVAATNAFNHFLPSNTSSNCVSPVYSQSLKNHLVSFLPPDRLSQPIVSLDTHRSTENLMAYQLLSPNGQLSSKQQMMEHGDFPVSGNPFLDFPGQAQSQESKCIKARPNERSVIKRKLEDAFRTNGFLVKTKEVSDGEATFCKFRQLRKYTRYYLKSWHQHLPEEINKLWKGFLPPKTTPTKSATSTSNST